MYKLKNEMVLNINISMKWSRFKKPLKEQIKDNLFSDTHAANMAEQNL